MRPTKGKLIGSVSRPAILCVALCLCVPLLISWAWVAGNGKHQLVKPAPEAIMTYKYYVVSNSTVPGAGLGVFARRGIPAGTVWSFEDAQDGATMSIGLQAWQSLTGFLEMLQETGYKGSHLLQSIWTFLELYGFVCDDPEVYVVAFTGTAFVNHAPTFTTQQQPPQQQLRRHPVGSALDTAAAAAAAAGRPKQHPGQVLQQAKQPSSRQQHSFWANSGEVEYIRQPRHSKLSKWQRCTVALAMRDIKAGEEMLEDYMLYSPPCVLKGDCPAFLKNQSSGAQPADPEWNQGLRVRLQHMYVANTTTPGGGLGVFAARDLPAGFVWNKEDVPAAFHITRAQWGSLVKLQKSLQAAGVSKPLVNSLVRAFRAHGIYCPLDDRVYMVASPSTLARRSRLQDIPTALPANVMPVVSATPGQAGQSGAAASCILMQITTSVKAGEEILLPPHKQRCNWPGFQDNA